MTQICAYVRLDRLNWWCASLKKRLTCACRKRCIRSGHDPSERWTPVCARRPDRCTWATTVSSCRTHHLCNALQAETQTAVSQTYCTYSAAQQREHEGKISQYPMKSCCRCDWPHWWVWKSWEALQSTEQTTVIKTTPWKLALLKAHRGFETHLSVLLELFSFSLTVLHIQTIFIARVVIRAQQLGQRVIELYNDRNTHTLTHKTLTQRSCDSITSYWPCRLSSVALFRSSSSRISLASCTINR